MPFLFLKSIIGFFTTWFKSIVEFFAKYPKQSLIILALGLAIFGGVKTKEAFDDLKHKNVELVSELTYAKSVNAQLKLDINTAVQVNVENQKTIEKMTLDVADSKKEADQLKAKQKVIQTQVVTIREQIAKSAPDEDGAVAKVLKDTIETIQKDREQSR